MGLFGDLFKSAREVIAGPQEPAPTVPRATPKVLARQLFAEFPDGVDADTLWNRCEDAGLGSMADVDREYDALRYEAEQRAQRKVSRIDPAERRILDLTTLESVRTRIKGSFGSVTFGEREKFGGSDYLLVREPKNSHDASAVAVYGKGRRVGYVSATRAEKMAPLLDALPGDAFRIAGAGTDAERGSRLWADLPTADALRRFLKAQG